MINIEDQNDLFLAIARELNKELTVYAVGGTAMMLSGFKETTLDIDLVFDSVDDKELFKKILKKIGYKTMDSMKIYGMKTNRPEMLTRGDERFDLFLDDIVYFRFSDKMKTRAKQIHEFDKLKILVADLHDIIMMKCATDRIKDQEDAKNIIEKTEIDWKILIYEAKNQIALGKTRAAFELGEFLEKLKGAGVDIPSKIIDELFEIVKRQANKKKTR